MFQVGRLPKGPVRKAVTIDEEMARRCSFRVKPERARMISCTLSRPLSRFSSAIFAIVKGCDSRGPKVGHHKRTCCPAFQENPTPCTVTTVISPAKACSSVEWPSRLPAIKPLFRMLTFWQSRIQKRYSGPKSAKVTAIQTL